MAGVVEGVVETEIEPRMAEEGECIAAK